MEDTQLSNAQGQPTPEVPPAASGSKEAELQVRVAELERAAEGRLRDLQAERQKRQELEQRLSQPPAPPADNGVVADAEIDKLIAPSVERRMAPVVQELQEYKRREALQYLSAKTGKSVDQIKADTELQAKLQAVAAEFGMTGDLVSITQRAYRALELKDLEAKESERKRNATIQSAAPMSGGAAPAPASSRTYSAEDFNRLPSSEYAALAQKGGFKKNPDGTFVYTPKK